MKKLYVLFIILPFLFSTKLPWHIDWDWSINFDFDSFISKFKSAIPEFLKKMAENLKAFIKKSPEEKLEFLKTLNSTISDLQEAIKTSYEKNDGNVGGMIKDLVEKTTEAAKYISCKVCDVADMTYEECRNDKKKLISNLIKGVKDNFGECSVIVKQISNLTENAEMNLKYILFLINSITENPDAIEKGNSQIVYDILNCLQDKMSEFWPIISARIGNDSKSLTSKKEITNLLLQSFSNLVNIAHFEEIDGFIQKASKLTGLISDSQAKKIHKGIFNVLKKMNEFGAGLYNISTNFTLNIIKNPGNLDSRTDSYVKWFEDKNKGIRIQLYYNYMLREKGATSLQVVIFDSPLVSILSSNETDGEGTSKSFVGITLYDKDNNEIVVKNFDIKPLKPVIYFKKKLYNKMTTCLYYNEEDDKMDSAGIDSSIVNLTEFDGEEYIKCSPKHLSSFTIGSYESASFKGDSGFNYLLIIIISASIIALIVIIILVDRCIRKRRKNFNKMENELNMNFNY